jgi:hypothetical protein
MDIFIQVPTSNVSPDSISGLLGEGVFNSLTERELSIFSLFLPYDNLQNLKMSIDEEEGGIVKKIKISES